MSIAITKVGYALEQITRSQEFMAQYAPRKLEAHMNMLWDVISTASQKQYKYLLALVYNQKHKELEDLLAGMGCPREGLIDPQLLTSPSDTSEDKIQSYDR